MLTNLKIHFQLSINDPRDEQWSMEVMSKLYLNGYIKYPTANLHVSCHLVPASKLVFTPIDILQQENQTHKEIQATLSWLQYVQYTADLLPLNQPPNSS